jgi:hypothetical protein
MATHLKTVRPKLGYEYQRIRYLSEYEWGRIKKELFEVLSFWGYDSMFCHYYHYPQDSSLSIALRRFYLSEENEGRKMPADFESGVSMGEILITFVYSYPVVISLEKAVPIIPLIAPSAICLEPHPSWEGHFGCNRTIMAIEKVYQESVLADYFRIVYCCLNGVTGFSTPVDDPYF